MSDLNCDFYSDCLWTNAPSDGLLDTSELYLFKKVDMKTFPIGPGNAAPKVGKNLASFLFNNFIFSLLIFYNSLKERILCLLET